MWVESITIENIKCFQEDTLSFASNPNEARALRRKPYKWITLLGENGVGKSTILQALALLLAGPEAAKELLPRPAGWVRDPNFAGKLTANLHKEEIDAGIFGKNRPRKTFSFSYFVTGSIPVEIDKQTYTEPAFVEERSKSVNNLSYL